jgi:hypothetical protein
MTAEEAAESPFGHFLVRTAMGRTPVEFAEHSIVRYGFTEPGSLHVPCATGLPPRPKARLSIVPQYSHPTYPQGGRVGGQG